MELRRCQVGSWSSNAYVLKCPTTRQSVLIDPGAEPDALVKMLENTQPIAILITHSHSDHIGALQAMQRRLAVPVVAHPGSEACPSTIKAQQWLHHDERLTVGHHQLRVYHTPGHKEDQVCYAIEGEGIVIVGDTIFEGGPGRTWSPQGFRQTIRTLRDIILTWPDDTICHPGHGDHFCLGDKQTAIEQFLRKDHGNFFGDASWGM